MAVKFVTPISRGVTEWFAYPEELAYNPELNGRHDLPDIDALIQSIATYGQLQPVTIRRADGGKPTLVAGFSRLRAVAHINANLPFGKIEKPLKLRCSYTQLTDRQAFIANIEENRVRNQTTPIDDAHNIQRLLQVHQMSEKEVAEVYRATPAWIRERMALLELVPEAEQAVRTGRVKAPAAKAIAKLTKELQKKVLEKSGPITAKDVAAVAPKPDVSKPSSKAAANLQNAVAAILREYDTEIAESPNVEFASISVAALERLKSAI